MLLSPLVDRDKKWRRLRSAFMIGLVHAWRIGDRRGASTVKGLMVWGCGLGVVRPQLGDKYEFIGVEHGARELSKSL